MIRPMALHERVESHDPPVALGPDVPGNWDLVTLRSADARTAELAGGVADALDTLAQTATDFYACGCHGGGTPTQGWPVVAVVVLVARRRRRLAPLA